MTTNTQYILEKEKALARLLHFHKERTEQTIPANPLLYIYDLPMEAGRYMHNHYLLNSEMYAEDYSTFLIVLDLLKSWSTPDINKADFILFPYNLYAQMPVAETMLANCIEQIRSIAGNKRIILFSIGDFCLRPGARSTQFERTLFNTVENQEKMLPSWITPSDIVICFESTPDLIHNNICIFPLIPLDPVNPFQSKKDLLFSFTGQYYKEGWPEGFVRSPANKATWETLARTYSANALITGLEKVTGNMNQNPFFEVPRRSVFTLCPRGISSWSFRTFEAILSGSIPVILSDSYTKPFSEYIPWDYFSITLHESQLSQAGDILSSIQGDIVCKMNKALLNNQHWFTARGLQRLIAGRLQQLKAEADL